MKKITIVLVLVFGYIMAFGQHGAPLKPLSEKPFILGTIIEMHSAELNENRILNIYLPDGYKNDDTTRYPVIYLLDGSADEDFIHVVGLVQFNNFPWINRVPKSIVVGIGTVDRRRDFTIPSHVAEEVKNYPTTGHSDRFISFIEKELQPFINNKYKTNDSRMIIGQSLGGLLASEIVLKKPYLFDKYIIISPSLWWDNGSLLELPVNKLQDAGKTEIYIGVGKEGLTPGKNARVMVVDANLLAEKFEKSGNKRLTVYFDYLPQEDHATISHQAIFNAFRMLYASRAPEKF